MEWLGGNIHSSLFLQNLNFLFSKLEGIGGNEFRFNEIFGKTPKIPSTRLHIVATFLLN